MEATQVKLLTQLNFSTMLTLLEGGGLIFFLIYALFSIREVSMMNKAVGTPLAPGLKQVAWLQVYLALLALAVFIIVLLIK